MPETPPRRLAVFSAGFLTQARVRRILTLAGWRVQVGVIPGQTAAVGVWGRRQAARRGMAAARRFGLPVVTVEDAFLRSVEPGRRAGPPIGLMIDEMGVHFDASAPSQLETLLETGDLSDPQLMAEAARGLALVRRTRLSKYNAFETGGDAARGHVLVVDQTLGDASIDHGGATAETFHTMLAAAKAEHPGREILIRTHPETMRGAKRGHFSAADVSGRVRMVSAAVNPWHHIEGAVAVYCVTSQLGFEAILAGLRPDVFGLPFYAGWGLSADRQSLARRTRRRSVEELFAAAMLRAPVWYDPYRDRLAGFEDAAMAILSEARAWRENRARPICLGMSRWKHAHLTGFFRGPAGPPSFKDREAGALAKAAETGRPIYVWAGRETDALRQGAAAAGVAVARVEDGFLRSVGLGARLLPPASLVVDDLGIYFDPTRPSRLEAHIAASLGLSSADLARAAALRQAIVAAGVSKYNVGAPTVLPEAADGRRIVLVPGQVEDDASIRLGAGGVARNADLLAAARAARPEAFLIYKPHPDVEAGLRVGRVDRATLARLADFVARDAAPAALLDLADEVWTMTSLMGFEGLLRRKAVHCLGQPFYAGWGLTTDHGAPLSRRLARPSLDQLAHAVLIDYPRYHDPVSGRPCPAEVVMDRLATRHPALARHRSASLGVLAWAQDRLRRHAYIWRR